MRAVTGVAAALPAEARLFRGWRSSPDPVSLHERLWLTVTGVGPERARAGALRLLAAGPEAMVSFGFAAGLAPQLRAGTLLLPRRVLAHDGRTYEIDSALRAAIETRLPASRARADGVIVETAEPLRHAADKAALHARAGAVAADMESAALAQAASEAGVPFAVLRAVVDPAERSVPLCALRALDADGKLHAGALCSALVRRPWEVAALTRLGADYRAARKALAVAAAGLAAAAGESA